MASDHCVESRQKAIQHIAIENSLKLSHSFVEKEAYESALAKFREMEEEWMTQEIWLREVEAKLTERVKDVEKELEATVQ